MKLSIICYFLLLIFIIQAKEVNFQPARISLSNVHVGYKTHINGFLAYIENKGIGWYACEPIKADSSEFNILRSKVIGYNKDNIHMVSLNKLAPSTSLTQSQNKLHIMLNIKPEIVKAFAIEIEIDENDENEAFYDDISYVLEQGEFEEGSPQDVQEIFVDNLQELKQKCSEKKEDL